MAKTGRATMIKIFKNWEEMESYYNYKTDTYEFIENGNLIDIVIDFELDINSNIRAGDIKAMDIKAMDINARDIQAEDIQAEDIQALNIRARDISAGDIQALDIQAQDINAWDINAHNNISAEDIKALNIRARDISAEDIKALDIQAEDIKAMDIQARDILYNSVCYARNTFICNSIKGAGINSKHFCLDSEIVISNKNKQKLHRI